MTEDKRYRECMAEIIGVLQKYDMAGAVTVVSKEQAMFKYHFPTWGCLILGEDHVRFRSKSADFPNRQAQHEATELSAHIVMQMRDVALNTIKMMTYFEQQLIEKCGMEHMPNKDFDPERSH